MSGQLTIGNIQAGIARLPAGYEREGQSHERELARVREYHELVAQESSRGGSADTVMPEEIERRVRDSQIRLHRAKRAVFDDAYRKTFEPDLRQERAAIKTGLSALVERASVARDKYDAVRNAARAHGAPVPPHVLTDDEMWALRAMLARLEAEDAPTVPARPRPMTAAAIVARVLGGGA